MRHGVPRDESRHHGVADIFIERAAMGEHHLPHAAVKSAQEVDDLLRTALLGHAGEADDIGEQHGDILAPDRAQGCVGSGQLIDQIGREIARQVGALALGRDLRLDRAAAPAILPSP